MADTIKVLRDAVIKLANEAVRTSTRHSVLGIAMKNHAAEVMALPVDPQMCGPIQVLDTNSPDFGKFYFLPSYDLPGSDHPIGP